MNKKILYIFALVIILITGYQIYRHTFYFVGVGSIFSQKIANIAISKNDPAICSKIKKGFDLGPGPSEEDMVVDCYYYVAEQSNNLTICNFITDPAYKNTKNMCISHLVKDFNDCYKLTDSYFEGSCLARFTEQGTDKSVCKNMQNITDHFHEDICYFGALKFSKDLNICENYIQTISQKNQCYTYVAMQTKNSSICDKIKGRYSLSEISYCKEYISNKLKEPQIPKYLDKD